MRFFGFGKLTLDDAFHSYWKIVDYCDARKKRGKPCLSLCSQGLQQITMKLIGNSPPRTAEKSLKITREIDGGNRWIKEEVELTLLKTGDFESVIDEFMDRAGRAEKDGAGISLGEQKDVGVTINCRTPNSLMCLLISQLSPRRFALYYSAMQKLAAPPARAAAAASPRKRATSEADATIAECRRWLADYQRRANIAGAKYDDIPEYVECIKKVGVIGTPEAMKVLQDVRANAMFTNILEAAVSAMDKSKFGDEKAIEKCGGT